MFKRGHKFSAEFKEEAVRLVLVQGLTISQVARDIGASQTTVSKWVMKARLDGYQAPIGESERGELQRLRKENRELKMEREILKKATAFFARESQ
jgi:transposase